MKIESLNLQPQWWACDVSTNVKMSNNKTNFGGSQEVETTESKVYIPIYRVSLVREKSLKAEYKYVRNPLSVYQIIKPYLEDLDREHFVVMLLDVKKKVIGINTVSIGILFSCPVHLREVFKPAIVANAAAVILVHNHPSGQPDPSQDDLALTVRLKEAGEILGIEVLDHVIVGEERYVSLKERGLV
jgi:DNA repair protein RadC